MSADEYEIRLKFDYPEQDRTIYFPNRPAVLDVETPDPASDPSWRRVHRNENYDLHWRGHVGTFIARELDRDISHAWHLDNFPAGYSLWEKTSKSNPKRKDRYLFGHGGKARFASPQQFSFHATWLYDDDYQTHKCPCILCNSNKTQGDINEEWFQERRRTRRPVVRASSPTQTPAVVGHSHRQTQTARTYKWTTAKGHLLDERSEPLDLVPERNGDLARLQPFRDGELVWVRIPPLEPSARQPVSTDEVIEFWPALIIGQKTWRQASGEGELETETKVYHLRLLVVGGECIVSEDLILPWECFLLPKVVRRQTRNPPAPVGLTSSLTELAEFPPFPTEHPEDDKIPRTFDHALLPLRIAFQQGCIIEEEYTPTNRYADPTEPGRKLYQGIWWGPERIWTKDLVRLAWTREELEKDDIKEPILPPSESADTRCHFLHISEISEDEEGTLFADGCLYELESEPGEPEPEAAPGAEALPQPGPRVEVEPDTLPKPPQGFRFRAVTEPGTHITLPFLKVAGRYHPLINYSAPHRALLARILNVPNVTTHANEEHLPDDTRRSLLRILSIMGLAPGYHSCIPTTRWKNDREQVIQDAEDFAKEFYWKECRGMGGDKRGRSSSVEEGSSNSRPRVRPRRESDADPDAMDTA